MDERGSRPPNSSSRSSSGAKVPLLTRSASGSFLISGSFLTGTKFACLWRLSGSHLGYPGVKKNQRYSLSEQDNTYRCYLDPQNPRQIVLIIDTIPKHVAKVSKCSLQRVGCSFLL